MRYTSVSLLLALRALFLSSTPSSVLGDYVRTSRRLSDDSEEEAGPHQGCKLLLKENHAPQKKMVGASFESAMNGSSYKVANEAGATAATCTNGMAGGYPCNAVDLLSMLDLSELDDALPGDTNNANDVWGWTHSSTGREFAIIGTLSGTAFVEITDVYNPIYVGGLATHTSNSSWRDIKTYNNYAIIGSEASGHGLQIFDLTQLLTALPGTTFSTTAHYDGVGSSHNVFVNEDTGFAYAVGAGSGSSSGCSGGLHVVNINDPTNPSFAGCFSSDGYTHDVQCVVYNGPDSTYTGKEICFASNEDTITVVDVTDKNNMVQLDRQGYTGDRYTHQGWLTEDHSYFIYNDELDEMNGVASKTRTHVMDVRDLNNILYVGYHDGRTAAIDHNLYVKGDLVFQANYRAGLNVLQMSDISNGIFNEVGYFDIYPNSDSASFNGAWSNYPYFPSGTIVVSGIEQGLFILRYTGDGTTPAPTPGPTPCAESEVTVSVLTDNYPSETSWELFNECTTPPTLELTQNDFPNPATTYTKSKCVPTNVKYRFEIKDSYGDGICCGYGSGSYSVLINGVEKISGGEFGASETQTFGTCGPSSDPPSPSPTKAPTEAPTDAPTSLPPTKTPTKAPTDAPTSLPPTEAPTDDCIVFQMDITTDDFPEETTWSVTKGCSDEVIFAGGSYTDANTEYTESVCLPPAQYTFTISDSYGDGILGNGKYSLSFGGEIISESEGQFDYEESFFFGSGVAASAFELTLQTDTNPREISWQLFNRCTGEAELSANAGYYRDESTEYTMAKCIPEGAYTFTIYDITGDGIGDGSYVVKYGGETQSDESTSFDGFSQSVNWGSGNCGDDAVLES